MRELIIATKNMHKFKEISEILSDIPFFLSPLPKDYPDVEEDGITFEENAVKKAKSALSFTGKLSIADDSGLSVEYLNGAPGIYSSRFAPTDKERISKLLNLLEGVEWEKRKAIFVCVVAIASPDGNIYTVRGEVKGYISTFPRGNSGFGFDPVFYLPEYEKTFAELSDIKNKISHRAKAFLKAKKVLKELY